MSWYRSGSIALTNGSTTITGTGTDWLTGAAVGEGVLAPDGKVYEIYTIGSATSITLGSPYLGSTASGQAYAIIPSQSYIRDLAAQAATLVNQYQSVKDTVGSGKFPDGNVTTPGFAWVADTDTGLRRTGTNTMSVVAGGADQVTLDTNGLTVQDAKLRITGSSDATKIAQFEVDGFTTVTTRTFTLPNATGTVALTSDVSASITTERTAAATLTNKTLTSPVINTPTLGTEALPVVTNNLPSVRPTLLLDFANARTVDPRITFTRASTATRTNALGLLETVASGVPRIDFDPITLACKGMLIEEARTNLLIYSEQFDNAAWTKINSSINANAATAPDGTTTADKHVENSTLSYHILGCNLSVTSGTAYTISRYIKAGERSEVLLGFDTVNSAFTYQYGRFNLNTGVATTYLGSPVLSMVNCGNGWYRCSVTATATATATATVSQQLVETPGAASANYTGDGTSGVYVWGAQLEAGSFPTSYIPSTETHTGRASTATYYGSNGLIQTAASGVARMNYNPANLTVAPKLLLEAAATNLLTYSEQFDNAAWTKTGTATVTPNTTASPDGTTTADTLNFPASLDRVSEGAIAVSASTPYTFSVWLAGSGTLNITLNTSGGTFKTATQSITLTATLTRYALSLTTNSDNTGLFAIIGRYDGAAGVGTATSCTAWGAQLEASSYPTSYIPTVASQVTRAADTSTSAQTTRAADVASMTGANFSSWYRADEGTFCVDGGASNNTTSGYAYFASANDATANNAILIAANESGDVINAEVKVSGSVTAGFYPSYTSGSTKIALSYKANDVNGVKDGVAGTTDTSSTLPTVTQLCIGANHAGNQINGHIARLAYYPKRVSNTELAALTA